METYEPAKAPRKGYVIDLSKETVEQRLLRRSAPANGGCREWLGALYSGYGYITLPGSQKPVRAHRAAYEVWVGPIPEGLTIDHLCMNRACINPIHLEAVSSRVNILRGNTLAAQNAKKTHCKNGHPFSGPNLYAAPSGDRVCRECGRAANKRYNARKAVV